MKAFGMGQPPQKQVSQAPSGNYPSYVNKPLPYNEQELRAENERLIMSPLMDSLRQVTGASPTALTGKWEGVGEQGAYSPLFHLLTMTQDPKAYDYANMDKRNNTPAGHSTPRMTLIHEMGHAGDNQTSRYYDESKAKMDTLTAFNPNGTRRAVKFEDKEKVRNLDPYYNNTMAKMGTGSDGKFREKNPEGFAQAFVNAFQFLQDTMEPSNMDWAAYLNKLEGNTPGMVHVLQGLLKHPLYAKHPLQRAIVDLDNDKPSPKKK